MHLRYNWQRGKFTAGVIDTGSHIFLEIYMEEILEVINDNNIRFPHLKNRTFCEKISVSD